MGNGLLGKKVVSSRDTELVYTVPANQVATFNVNVLNNGAEAGNVFVYVSDKQYQSKDFEAYNIEDPIWTASETFEHAVDLVGFGGDQLLTTMQTSSLEPLNPGTARAPRVPKGIVVDQTAGTVTATDVNATVAGNPLVFQHGSEYYVRAMTNGAVYTLANYASNGSATTSAATWGLDATDNNQFATNVDGAHALFYVQGPANSGNLVINSIADWRLPTAATYGTAFPWAAGTISHLAGIKTTEERFLTGTVFGAVYLSTDGAPTTSSMLQSGGTLQVSSITGGGGGNMIAAIAIEGATSGEGNVFIALSSNAIVYAAYDATTVFETTATNWNAFNFPADVTYEDVSELTNEAGSVALILTDGRKFSTADLGVTWVESKHYPTIPFNVTVAQDAAATDKYAIDGVIGAEITLIRGRKYRLFVKDTTMNTHPLLLSATADGTHNGGSVYETGVTYKMGNPTATSDFAVEHTAHADYTTDYATYNSQPRFIEIEVAADAPDELHAFCSTHAGEGFTISVVDEPTEAPHDTKNLFMTSTIWNAANGDANKKYDIFFDGALYSREERFYELPDVDLYDKAGLGAGALLERTGIMASAGEQVIVKTDGEDIIVRVHGIEEGVS